MNKFSSHSLLQCRPNFVTSLNEFIVFLKVTSDDLSAKIETLKAQKNILMQNRKAKNYLSCQIYMLKKYVQRLDKFNVEIETRLEAILNKEKGIASLNGDKGNENSCPISKESHTQSSVPDEVFNESAIDCGDLEINKSNHSGVLMKSRYNESGESLYLSASSESAYDDSVTEDPGDSLKSITSLNEEKDSSINNNDINTNGSITSQEKGASNIKNMKQGSVSAKNGGTLDNELKALIADMKKMKRRCKHVLDVTDKYCVLNNETDLQLDVEKDAVADLNASLSKSPTTSLWSTRSSRACSPISGTTSPSSAEKMETSEDEVDGPKSINVTNLQLPSPIHDRGLVKMTLGSFGGHLGVLIKTYTRRHS
jgi:hypothetical protein